MSAQLDLPHTGFDFVQLSGSWSRERHPERTPLHSGIQSIRSVRGASGHQNSPAIALAAHDATEYSGDVYGAVLAYSGNFLIEAECEQYGTARLCAGINPENFSWMLAPGESFETPEVYLTYSGEGLGGMSRNLHDFMRSHLIRDGWADRKRPLLVNSWEAAYFDFDSAKLLGIAESAAKLGIEMLVLDDGWFGARNDDTTSLGDWFVNTDKIGDLGELVKKINALGVKFGLWFEPEMISEKSELYRKHPEWVLHEPGRRRSIGRQQMLLDMSRPDVVQYLFETISNILHSANIEYVKWDMNRNLTEVYSDTLPPERQGEVAHRFMLGVYRLHEMLLKEFPGLLIEGCSGGGGRFDAGMLGYVPQIWCSDDTDAMERILIQLGTSYFYPVSTIGAHVSVCPNHITGRSTPFATRGNIALSGTFGYELDLTRLAEEDQALVRKQVADYHRYHHIIATGDLYRLSDSFKVNPFDAWMYVSKDRKEALVTAVCRFCQPNSGVRFVRPRGLDPETVYEVDGMQVSGATLMSVGFQAKLEPGDGASRIYYLKAL
ncbi:MAG: alpha-galactosidase, partial [Victivallales bacterium]